MNLESAQDENAPNENLPILYRAAEISMLDIGKCSIGPKSTYEINVTKELTNDEQCEKPKLNETNIEHQQVIDKISRMDLGDLQCIQQKILEKSIGKKIETEVRKKLEEKRDEEIHNYEKIKKNIEMMRLEAEKRHENKMKEFEKRLQIELEKERQKELVYQEQRKALADNTKKIQEEKEKKLKEQIRKFDDVFTKQEAAFLKIIQSCNPEMAPSLDVFKKQLKDIKNFKDSQKNSLDSAKSSCIKLDALCQNLQKEIREFEAASQVRKAQKESEEKLAAEQQALAQAQKVDAIVPIQIAAVQPRSQDQNNQVPLEPSPIQSETFKIYNHYKQLLNIKKEQTKKLDETPELQQIRFALKVAINNSINLLNEKNKTTLVDGYQKLFNLLSGQRVNTPKGSIAITDHNEAPDWCRLRIAEKLIDRCDKEPSIVFYTAALTIALWQKFPDFGEIFKAMLYKECPFLMPFKPPKLNTQSNEEFLSSWGFRLTNGVCEEHVYYEGRTTKFASLLGALWISFPRKGESEISPFDIKHAWMYFSNVLNTNPDSNYFHIVGKLLEISGFMLHQVYGRQFVKLMMLIRDKYIPAVHSAVDEETSASFNRLRDTINKFFTENKFIEPNGRVVLGYW
ncbi:mRNA export factor Gle1 isoform X2 [Chironomus tepperi]|uniref:mRNA export factor Gle1 isoform X2 n=1 Tax=Chironomus tepperi TaxID=113505 RepID=UPI00391F92E8